MLQQELYPHEQQYRSAKKLGVTPPPPAEAVADPYTHGGKKKGGAANGQQDTGQGLLQKGKGYTGG